MLKKSEIWSIWNVKKVRNVTKIFFLSDFDEICFWYDSDDLKKKKFLLLRKKICWDFLLICRWVRTGSHDSPQLEMIRGLGAEPPVGDVRGEIPLSLKNFWIRVSPECTTKVKYKIDHNSKTKNRTKKKLWNSKIRFWTLRICWDIFFYILVG